MRSIFILLFPFCALFGVEISQFPWAKDISNQIDRNVLQERIDRFFENGAGVEKYITLTDEELILFDRPEGQEDREVECRFVFEKKEQTTQKLLKWNGLKIAIDPGHFGGEYAYLEQRYVELYPSLEIKEQITFNEGTLNYLTALHLKTLLEEKGANVFLTRQGLGKGAYPDSFFDWLKKNSALWSEKGSLRTLFRKYNRLDLRARAEKINAFGPDLTIVIHYNAHSRQKDLPSNRHTTHHNFNLAFIPGAFCAKELRDPKSRYELLRLLLTDHFVHSERLASCILKSWQEKLNVPLVCLEDKARYLETACCKVELGLYTRNLALTRLVHSPVCYGETLIQNNIDECQNLGRMDAEIGGHKCSSRIQEVAQSYFDGICAYLGL